MGRYSRVSGLAALRNAREGIAAVEFALLAPVLTLIFIAAVSFGLASWTKMQVSNAARAGGVYAAKYGFNQTNITAAAKNATPLPNVTVTATQATASCTNPTNGTISSANGATTCPSTGAPPGTYVTVTTQVPYSFTLPIPGIADMAALSGNAVARIN